MVRFVLLAMARSGSYMLGSALNSHPEIRVYGELLKRNPLKEIDYLDLFQRRNDAEQLIQGRLDAPVEFVASVFATANDVKAVGFKLMLGQNEVALDHLMSDRSVLKLLLRRDNMLAGYSSQVISRETEQHVALTSDQLRTIRVTFVAKDFERFRKRRDRLYARAREQLLSTNQDYLELEYRDAVRGPGIADAIAFLGLNPSEPTETATRKRNATRVIERFVNTEEVASYMAGIGHEEWLEDELA